MALPLPKVVADVGPGGGAVTAMGGMNALSNAMLDTQINRVKAQYAPLTTQAEAASKLAYANLMGPQFLAKLMGNPDVVANSPQLKDPATVARLYQAGMGGGTGNALMQMPGMQGQPQPSNNSLSGWLADKIKGITGGRQSPNALAQPVDVNAVMGSPGNSEIGQATSAWMKSPEALEQAQKDGMYTVPPDAQLLQWYSGKQGQQGQGANSGMSFDKNGNNVVASPEEIDAVANRGQTPDTYAENAARYKSIMKEGETLGTARGKDISDLGKQQLDLSNSGIILDRLVGITQKPEFQKMRDQIPFFQDKQLWYLSKTGTKAQQDMIGDLVSTAQAFKASTVNSFKGKALEKEFNLADKIKIDENDTMGVIQGKLRSLKTLKDIAESKNDIILGLMSDKHMNLGEATKTANKMVDTASIEKEVDSVLNPQPSEHDIQYMMKKRNLSRDEIVKQLKAKGYKNVS